MNTTIITTSKTHSQVDIGIIKEQGKPDRTILKISEIKKISQPKPQIIYENIKRK